MTSNLLSLYSAKTEFLLIGLKQQLSKIHNLSTSRDTTQSTRYLCTTVFRNTIIVSNTSRMLFLVLLYCRLKNSNTSITPRTLFSLHLTSLWSNYHHRSFQHASSPDLWNQLPTSLRIPHPNYSPLLNDLL